MALTKVPSNLDATVATTQSASDNSTNVATTAYVTTALSNLVDSSPSALNTLNELAAALGDNENFATDVTASIATKLPLAGGTLTGNLGVGITASSAIGIYHSQSLANGLAAELTNTQSSTGSGIVVKGGSSSSNYSADFRDYNNTSLMRIRGDGKVGIGETSPETSLHIKNAGNSFLTLERSGTTGGTGKFGINMEGGSSQQTTMAYDDGGKLVIGRSSDPATMAGFSNDFILDSSGNVGIGTSPSAKLDVRGSTGSGTLTHAVFTGTTNRGAEIRTRSDVSGGQHSGCAEFNSADSEGTGGDIALSSNGNIRMFINGDGKVGIGTTDPKELFDVTVPNAKTASRGVFAYLGKTNEGSNYQALQCFQIGGNAADERRYEFQTIEQGVANNGIICLQKSGGRVFIGHDSADGNSDKLVISGSIGISNDAVIGAGSGYGPSNGAGSSSTIQLYSSSSGNMTFSTNYSAGDEVHNMSGNTKFVVKRSAAGTEAVNFYTLDGGFRVGALNSGYHHTMRLSGPSTYYFDNRCEASGGFHTYSDEKLKKEITTITGALDKVAVMNGVTFKWKDAENRGSGDAGKQFGVIAQNMLEVDSELPNLNVDPLAESGNEETDEKYYSMDYSRLTPYFIEAIKELKTKLEAAEARITELES